MSDEAYLPFLQILGKGDEPFRDDMLSSVAAGSLSPTEAEGMTYAYNRAKYATKYPEDFGYEGVNNTFSPTDNMVPIGGHNYMINSVMPSAGAQSASSIGESSDGGGLMAMLKKLFSSIKPGPPDSENPENVPYLNPAPWMK